MVKVAHCHCCEECHMYHARQTAREGGLAVLVRLN